MARHAALLASALALVGCAQFPQVDAFPSVGSASEPPALLPLDGLLAQAAGPSVAEDAGAALAARAARLKARARAMRGPVLDPQTRDRLAEAIAEGRS
jgi:hypothetical protein